MENELSLTCTERLLAQNLSTAMPDAVGLNIKDTLDDWDNVKGRVIRINLRDGFDLTAYDLVADGLIEKEEASEPCVAINIMLRGEGYSVLQVPEPASCKQIPRKLKIPFRPCTSYVCVMEKGVESCMVVPNGSTFTGIDIRLSFEFIERQLGLLDLRKLNSDHFWHLGSNQQFWVGLAASTQLSLQNAKVILKESLGNQAQDLMIEAKALNILSEIFTLLKAEGIASNSVLSKHKSKRIIKAHQLLMHDLAKPWTIRELANKVGMNEKMLKQGFKIHYGKPIYQHLQAARLNQAKCILSNGEETVATVSLAVGYSNPSHFSYLFKRKFGYSPSEMKNFREI